MELIINYISILGSFVFAISGALTAMNKRFDPIGVFIIAFVTAVGGGTIRDILIEGESVFWLREANYIYFIVGGTILAIIFKSKLGYIQKPLLFFDAIGLGLYTITGVQIGLNHDLNYINCIILGAITGVFGGILRDILVNKIPVIFKKEIYATISITGGIMYLLLLNLQLSKPLLQILPILFMIIVRLVVIYYNISLPTIYRKNKLKKI